MLALLAVSSVSFVGCFLLQLIKQICCSRCSIINYMCVFVCVQALVATETPGLGYMDLLRMLTGPVYSQSAALPHKQAYCSIAKCVAALTRACPTEGPAVVGQFIQVIYLPVCLTCRGT